MTAEQDDGFRASIIAAVQAELDRHAQLVLAETAKLRDDAAAEREQIRANFADQIAALAQAFEQSQGRSENSAKTLREQLEARLETRVAQAEAKVSEVDSKASRRVDEMQTSLESLVEGAARPLLQAVRAEQESVERKVDALGENLRQFDEQAARMVTWVNDVQQAGQRRADEFNQHLNNELDRRIAELSAKVDEGDAAMVRRHTETSQMVTQRVGDAEERINQRVLGLESRMKEETGSRLAEMDAHLGKVSAGLDNTLTVLNDRMASIESWLQGLDDRLERAREEFSQIDTEAIEELKEKLSTAAGEAMLVRIEMERLDKKLNEQVETVTVRVTEVEAQLADATMDVSTAVQLERLEELERAVMELDPNKFVMREDVGAAGAGHDSAVDVGSSSNGVA